MRLLSLSTILALPLLSVGQSRPAFEGAGAFIPDSIAAGVLLRDTTSAIAVLGRFPTEELLEDHRDMPRASFFNQDSTEILTVYIHYGGYRNEYCELRISEPEGGSVRAALPIARFTSGRGVKLGLSVAEVVRMFGNTPARDIGNNGNVRLSYAIKDFAASTFLQRFNYPSYYARFSFEHDQLIDYRFGFEYP